MIKKVYVVAKVKQAARKAEEQEEEKIIIQFASDISMYRLFQKFKFNSLLQIKTRLHHIVYFISNAAKMRQKKLVK